MRILTSLLVTSLFVCLPPTARLSASAGTSAQAGTDNGSWAAVAPMSTARSHLAAATGPAGRIYAIGGDSSGVGAANGALHTTEAFDPGINTWTAVAPMPTARYDLAAATGPNGRIYAIGGYSGSGFNYTPNDVHSTVEAYDPATSTWKAMAPMSTARWGLAAATGPDGRIYAIGGNSGGALNAVEAYDPGTNTWQAVAPMPTARYFLAAATGKDGRIYAIGGCCAIAGGVGIAVNTVEAYDPATDSWTAVAPMPTARLGLAAAMGPNGRIYAIGGYTKSAVNTVEAYDPAANTWQAMPPLPTPREDLAAATEPDGRIYAIGGYDGTSVMNRVDVFTAPASATPSATPRPPTATATSTSRPTPRPRPTPTPRPSPTPRPKRPSFAFTGLQTINDKGRPQQVFRAGARVIVKVAWRVKNLHGTTPYTVSRIYQRPKGKSWTGIGLQAQEDSGTTSSGSNFRTFQFIAPRSYSAYRITVRIRILGRWSKPRSAVIYVRR